MTGLAPTLSMILPTRGAVRLPIAKNDSEALIWVLGQANCCSRGSTNTPKAYCPVPMATVIEANTMATIATRNRAF